MKSLQFRLLFGIALLLALALGGFGTLAYLSAARDNRAELDALLSTKAFALARLMDAKHNRVAPFLEQGLELDRDGCFLQVFAANGELLARSANLAETIPLSPATGKISPERLNAVLEETRDSHGRPVRLATFSRNEFPGGTRTTVFLAQAGAWLGPREAGLKSLLKRLVLVGAAFFLVTFSATFFVLSQWLRSLNSIEDTARRISAQNLARQRVFVPAGDAELARLAESFNGLLDRLESAHGTQQRFVADASHELRTPLTILRGEIEVALRKPRGAEDYRAVLESNREEIERLSRLVENLLTLASADSGEALAHAEAVDLSALARAVTQRLADAATAKNLSLTLKADAPVPVNGDSAALERVAFNLVENAIRYSPPGETVTVSVGAEGTTARLEVADTGAGIAAEHLPRLFDRFYRVDKARSRELGGAGLGLAIVKALVETHGGQVEVTSQLGHGSRFVVRLPLAVTP